MNKFLIFAVFLFLISCNKQDNREYNYSESETEQFLENIVKNAKISIGDITEIKKQPTDELYLLTRYPLSKAALDEYHKNKETLINKDNDISDFATYSFKDYELINEKNEKLKGYITIEFEMPKNIFSKIKKEVKIPVNITVYDKIPE